MDSMDKATQLTADLKTGDSSAAAELLPLVYDHLHEMASRHFSRQRKDHTLQATALVHEVFLKMVNQPRAEYTDEAHFCSVAAMAMRQILIDHAAKRYADCKAGVGCLVGFREDFVSLDAIAIPRGLFAIVNDGVVLPL